MSSGNPDPIQAEAKRQAEQLSGLARRLASALGDGAALPPAAVAAALLDAGKMNARLEKHLGRLRPPAEG
jgi:hypothetical protein